MKLLVATIVLMFTALDLLAQTDIPPLMASFSPQGLMDIFLAAGKAADPFIDAPSGAVGWMLLLWAAIMAFLFIVRMLKG